VKIKRGGRTSSCLELARRTLLTRLISPPILFTSKWTEVSSSADRWVRTLRNPTSNRQKEQKSRHVCTYQIMEFHLFYFSQEKENVQQQCQQQCQNMSTHATHAPTRSQDPFSRVLLVPSPPLDYPQTPLVPDTPWLILTVTEKVSNIPTRKQTTTMSEHVSARHARAQTLARPFFTRPPCSLPPLDHPQTPLVPDTPSLAVRTR
jgi:hypothetical protein